MASPPPGRSWPATCCCARSSTGPRYRSSTVERAFGEAALTRLDGGSAGGVARRPRRGWTALTPDAAGRRRPRGSLRVARGGLSGMRVASVTPTQLRAFAAVVRLGSVKKAAVDLEVSEAAVSLNIGQLRKELGDRLFIRTASGIAFTPGGLRLASRAAEMLGLQDRTILEVSQAGAGRRLLRLAASSLFAEHAAPGLIDLFASRADDLDVELSVHGPRQFHRLLHTRAVDVAIGPRPDELDDAVTCTPFLNYELFVVAGADDPLGRPPERRRAARPDLAARVRRRPATAAPSRRSCAGSAYRRSTSGSSRATPRRWRRPSATRASRWRSRSLVTPRPRQGLPQAGRRAAAADQGHLERADAGRPVGAAGRGRAGPVRHDAAGDPGDAARVGRDGRPVQAVHPRHACGADRRGRDARPASRTCRPAAARRSTAAPPPSSTRSAEPGRGRPRVHPDHPVGAPPQPGHGRRDRLRRVAVPAVRADDARPPRGPRCACREVEQRPQVGGDPGAAEPVGHQRGRLLDRGLGRAVREHRRQPGQPGGEREHLGVRVHRERPHEVQVRGRLRLHRLAHVAQQHDPPRPVDLADADQPDRLPAGTPGPGDRRPHRDP